MMRYGLFYDHQLPKPWNEGDEEIPVVRASVKKAKIPQAHDSVFSADNS